MLYRFITELYFKAVQVAGVFGNTKARQRHRGQAETSKQIKHSLSINQEKHKVIWFHCASLGEYEQGRPVMEKLKREKPELYIVVTYFSPSGYIHHKSDHIVDSYFYLPNDTPKNAGLFINHIKPMVAVFVKYEFWKHYIDELNNRNIPLVYVSAIFRPSQPFFQNYGKSLLKSLKSVNHFFVQNQESADLLTSHGINQQTVAGDVRFDRAVHTTRELKEYPVLKTSFNNERVIIFGSAWQKELSALVYLLDKKLLDDFKIIVAPHDVSAKSIQEFTKAIKIKCDKLSTVKIRKSLTSDILIVDTIGDLKYLYQFAQLAVIGGGFNEGIHNIIEPAAFGIPVFFGPKSKKFPEAAEMIRHETGFEFKDEKSLSKALIPFLTGPQLTSGAAKKQKALVLEQTGAGDKVTAHLLSLLQH